MRKVLIGLVLGVLLVVWGCSTAPEVKQLSLKQIEYFDAAIEAVKLQSEALILVAEKLKEQAEARIANTEQESRDRLQNLASTTIPSLPESERKKTAKKMLQQVAQIREAAVNSRQKLANDLAAIKLKTQELEAYIRKMKEVQVALDAYLQSEKAGEKVLKEVLKHPTVDGLLSTANDLLPKVREGVNEMQILLKGLTAGG